METEFSRRPLKTRDKNWPRHLALLFVRLGFTPNQISLTGLVTSAVGALCLFFAAERDPIPQAVLFALAAVCIQLRLLCNLLDGLMAVEGGRKTKSGEIFNEFPDRVADALLFPAAGYSIRFDCAHAVELGYLCAIGAIVTTYVRVFGGAVGLAQDFCGPMAKQQRMAALTIACVLSAAEAIAHWEHRVMLLGLTVIFVGSLFTAARRTFRIAHSLNAR